MNPTSSPAGLKSPNMNTEPERPAEGLPSKIPEVAQPAQDDEEWDDCLQIPTVADGDYTLVDDLVLLDIKSPSTVDSPTDSAGGLTMPDLNALNRLISSVEDYFGSSSTKAKDGLGSSAERFGDFFETIDRSFTGTYAMTYKQHVSCGALLAHSKFLDAEIKELYSINGHIEETTARQVKNAQRTSENLKSSIETLRVDIAPQDERFKVMEMIRGPNRPTPAQNVYYIRTRFTALETSLKQLGAERADFFAKIDLKDSKIRTQTADQKKLERRLIEDLGHSRQAVANKNGRILELETQLRDINDAKNGKILELETQLRETKDKLIELEEELGDATVDLGDLTAQWCEVEEELHDLRRELPSVKKELVDVNETLRDFAQQVLSKQATIERLEAMAIQHSASFTKELDDKSDAIDCLREQLESWKQAEKHAVNRAQMAEEHRYDAEELLKDKTIEIEMLKELRQTAHHVNECQTADLKEFEQRQEAAEKLAENQSAEIEQLKTVLLVEKRERQRQETMKKGVLFEYHQLKAKYEALRNCTPSSSSRAK